MQRALAVIGAVLIVALALVVRSAIDDDGGGGGGGGRSSGATVVVCDTDLRAACDALGDDVEVRVEDSAATAASLAAGELDDVDAWVTSSAWLEVARSRSASVVDGAEALATTDAVVAADRDRADAIVDLCGDDPIWRCLTDAAGRPWADLGGQATWGPMRTGLPDADTATGLGVLASVAVGYVGDADFAANDFTDLRGPLTRLAEPSGTGDRDLLTRLVRVRGTYSAGGFVEAQVVGRDDVARLTTEPEVAVSAVLVSLAGGDDVHGAAELRTALVERGWETASGEPGTLLKSGVMAALHSLWTEITR